MNFLKRLFRERPSIATITPEQRLMVLALQFPERKPYWRGLFAALLGR